MRYNKLIPELNVMDIKKSLDFYVNTLRFSVEYDRPEKKFTFLSLQGSQLMLDGTGQEGTPWFVGEPTYPRGKGMHFQIQVKDIKPFIEALKKAGYPIKAEPMEYWFRRDNALVGMNAFLVMDPDGYLLMFYEGLGMKPAS